MKIREIIEDRRKSGVDARAVEPVDATGRLLVPGSVGKFDFFFVFVFQYLIQ